MMDFSALVNVVDRSVQRHLGDEVLYTSGAGVSRQVRGVFDRVYQRPDMGEPGVSSSSPSVFLLLADLPTDPSDDVAATVTVAGITFEVAEAEPDGKGGVQLLLHVAS